METKKNKIHCNYCQRDTNHSLMYTNNVREYEDDIDENGDPFLLYDFDYENNFFKCDGCDHFSYELKFYNSGELYEVSYFPSRLNRAKPRWAHSLPSLYDGIFNETYLAYQNNCPRLVVMGARTLIDLYIVNQIGDAGTFKQKLKMLVNEGHITKNDSKILNSALEIGSASAHRSHLPDIDDLNSTLDIVENLLHRIFLLNASERMDKKTPKRSL